MVVQPPKGKDVLIPQFTNWYQMYQEAPWVGAGFALVAVVLVGAAAFTIVAVGCAATYGPVAAVAAWFTRTKPASESNDWFFNEPAA